MMFLIGWSTGGAMPTSSASGISGAVLCVLAAFCVPACRVESRPPGEQPAVQSTTVAAPVALPPAAPPRLGEWFSFSDSAWWVNGAGDFGRRLPSNNQFVDNAKTMGKFIVVRFSAQNNTASEQRIFNDPQLVDSAGRRFRTYDRQTRYL